MAIILSEKTPCSICGKILRDNDEIVSTPHFIGPEHPLHQYSDSGMHKTCFAAWAHRDEFRDLYNQSYFSKPAPLGHHFQMQPDGEIVAIRDGKIVDVDVIAREALALYEKQRAKSGGNP